MKIAFTRELAINLIHQLNWLEEDEDIDYSLDNLSLLNDDKLLNELYLSGYIVDLADISGVFNTVPLDSIDATIVASITGYPISLKTYHNSLN